MKKVLHLKGQLHVIEGIALANKTVELNLNLNLMAIYKKAPLILPMC